MNLRSRVVVFLSFKYNRYNEPYSAYDELAGQYLEDPATDPARDLQLFIVHMSNHPPLTTRNYVQNLLTFFSYYDINFPRKVEKQIKKKIPRGKARTVKKDLDPENLKQILIHLDALSRAIVLTLVSSGMRIGECLQLTFTDVDLQKTPAEINVRGEYTKSGEQRTTFMSDEAVEAIIEWLKIRDQFLKSSQNKNRGLVKAGYSRPKTPAEDPRVFPFTYSVIAKRFLLALKRAGLHHQDPGTHRSQISLHATRTFFRSQLSLGCPLEVVEAMMEHTGYLTTAYRRYTKKQLAELYLKGVHHVQVYADKNLIEMEREFDQRLKGTSEIVEKLAGENITLRSHLADMETRLTDAEKITKQVASLQEIMDKLREQANLQQ